MDRHYLDARYIPCQLKHTLIFKRWDMLSTGGFFILINDHDPLALKGHFEQRFPRAFDWEYLKAEENEFQVKITRLARTETMKPGAVGGCGSAGGSTVGELDARGLEPPEPMVRILTEVERLAAGGRLIARTDRRPIHLYPELDARQVAYESLEEPDGSWLTRLSR